MCWIIFLHLFWAPVCVFAQNRGSNLQLLKNGAIFGVNYDPESSSTSGFMPSGENYMLHEAVNNHLTEYSEKYPELYPFVFDFDSRNVIFSDSYQVGQQICEQMKVGVTSFFSAAPDRSAENMLRSFSDRFQIPYISASHFITDSRSSYSGDMPESYVPVAHEWSVNVRPFFTKAVMALQKKLKWDKITYITDTVAGTSAVKELLSGHDLADFEVIIRKVETDSVVSHENTLKQLRDLSETRIMLDATVRGTFNFFRAAHGLQMLLPSYHYIVLNPAARDYQALKHFTKGGMNITALSIQQLNSQEKTRFVQKLNNASHPSINNTYAELPMLLAYDAIAVLRAAWAVVVQQVNTQGGASGFDCYRGSSGGVGPLCLLTPENLKQYCMEPRDRNPGVQKLMDLFMRALRQTKLSGVTGNIQFDSRGYRKNLSLELHEISYLAEDKEIGKWSDSEEDFIIDQPNMGMNNGDDYVDRHLIITSIVEPPFLMLKEQDPSEGPLIGNQRFEGYCVELADMLSRDLDFTYSIRLVEDNQYGSLVQGTNGTWNGMIGEVMTGKADLAIAPLTINADRQRVVAFTKPFMNIGISIMIKRPQSKLPGPLSFLDPFSDEIWYGIIIAYCGVSLGLFLVARFSPIEWQDKVAYREIVSPTGGSNYTSSSQAVYIKHNDFTLNNCMWFSLGALMQQGTDIAPKAPASRIVGGVWWFFTLIIISSYTANLAAFLTVERMVTPINNADELPAQKEISYGTRSSGSTKQFFNNSQIEVFKKMWDYMSSATPSVFEPSNKAGIERVRNSNGKYAFLIESAMNEYVEQQKPCDTLKVGPNLDSKGYGIAAAHNSPWVKNITLKILKYQEDGALERLKTTWWVDKGECGGSFSSTSTDSTNSLGLSSVAGIFYILISGLALAMLSAVAEYAVKSWKQDDGKDSRSKKKTPDRLSYEPVECLRERETSDSKDFAAAYLGMAPPSHQTLQTLVATASNQHPLGNQSHVLGGPKPPTAGFSSGAFSDEGNFSTDLSTNYATVYNAPLSHQIQGDFNPPVQPVYALPPAPSYAQFHSTPLAHTGHTPTHLLGLSHSQNPQMIVKSRKSNHTDV